MNFQAVLLGGCGENGGPCLRRGGTGFLICTGIRASGGIDYLDWAGSCDQVSEVQLITKACLR